VAHTASPSMSVFSRSRYDWSARFRLSLWCLACSTTVSCGNSNWPILRRATRIQGAHWRSY
jgi:hypothetical protein